MAEPAPERAIRGICDELATKGRKFALLAMKILSMTDIRLQDRLDAQRLLQLVPNLDLDVVRDHLARITQRGFHRDQDLVAKLESVLAVVNGVAS
jgi:hypothetical protein